jgi:hypothetical protein
LYNTLRQAERNKDLEHVCPSWILLDEANLSPIEYYWSSFLTQTDSENNRQVFFSNDEGAKSLSIPESVRFLATVNTDITTEELTPRVLDRVPIIQIDYDPDYEYEPNSETDSYECEPISSTNFLKVFAEGNAEVDRKYADKFKLIKSILGKSKTASPIIISPRKQNAVFEYIKVCAPLLKDINPDSNEWMALDFAVAQYVLPLIKGHGDDFKNILLELKSNTIELSRTSQVLDKIILSGQRNHDVYSFVA